MSVSVANGNFRGGSAVARVKNVSKIISPKMLTTQSCKTGFPFKKKMKAQKYGCLKWYNTNGHAIGYRRITCAIKIDSERGILTKGSSN